MGRTEDTAGNVYITIDDCTCGLTGSCEFQKEMQMVELGTAVDCSKGGHCWHEGTAVVSLQCCRCGQYRSPGFVNYDNRIQEGRVHKIPNIRALKDI